MEVQTTAKEVYRGDKGEKATLRKQETLKEDKPIVTQSSYQKNFPNWENGKADVFHEKHPQYPFYSMPFRGESSYNLAHTGDKMKELKS